MTEVREPSNIIEMVEMVRSVLSSLSPDEFDKDTIEGSRMILDTLPKTDFYEINEDVYQASTDLFLELFQGKKVSEIKLDHDTRLPSERCGFWWPGSTAEIGPNGLRIPVMFLARALNATEVMVVLVGSHTTWDIMGGYSAGGQDPLVVPPGSLERGDDIYYATATLKIAALCSVINQPGFLKTEPAGSRQQRRAASRSGGYATDAWHKITWNIGEEVKAKLTRDEPVRCMPLHYTRGHWRKAEEGWKNTTQRKDGLWYQWIEGFWSGHPAFGIKKSYHAPKMGDAA